MTHRHPSVPRATKCTAHSSRTREPCRAYAIRGATVCIAHGGAAKHVRAKAAETLAEWRSRRVLELDKGLDIILKDVDGGRLAALMVKQPGLVAKIIEVADRLRGGGEQQQHSGEIRITLGYKPQPGEDAHE